METPAHYQDLKYHLHELEEKIKLHEEWAARLAARFAMRRHHAICRQDDRHRR